MISKSAFLILCLLLLISLPTGCQKKNYGAARAAHEVAGRQAEEKGDFHEAAKHYAEAIELAESEGYVSESLYESLHRVQTKINKKYGD